MREQFEEWLTQVADDNDTARAERLTELFERSTFTRQKDLADKVGVETRTVQRWLIGEGIAKRYWTDLADALDTTVRYLVFGEQERQPIDESQLDRIEAKLDRLLNLYDEAEETPAEVLEREADRLAAQRSSSAATQSRRPAKRRAS